MLDDIIRYCLISSPLKPIRIADDSEIRAQINILLNAPFGTGKTHLIEQIERHRLGLRIMNWTEVALLGSIRKDGEIVPPMTIVCAGKTVLIDEFQNVPAKFRLPLLSLMEEQRAERMLNFKVPQPIRYDSKYWSVFAQEGYMTFKIRSSFIVATSKAGTTHLDRMLQSRCIQVNIQVGYEDMKRGYGDIKFNDIVELRNELDNKQGYFKKSEWEDVRDTVIEELRSREISPNYAYRVSADILRIMNIKMLIGEDPDEAWKYLDFILHGILGSSFTPIEIKIYQSLNGRTPLEEITSRLNIPKEYSKLLIERLIEKGLIKEVKKNVFARLSR